jgi:hypothetical protein
MSDENERIVNLEIAVSDATEDISELFLRTTTVENRSSNNAWRLDVIESGMGDIQNVISGTINSSLAQLIAADEALQMNITFVENQLIAASEEVQLANQNYIETREYIDDQILLTSQAISESLQANLDDLEDTIGISIGQTNQSIADTEASILALLANESAGLQGQINVISASALSQNYIRQTDGADSNGAATIGNWVGVSTPAVSVSVLVPGPSGATGRAIEVSGGTTYEGPHYSGASVKDKVFRVRGWIQIDNGVTVKFGIVGNLQGGAAGGTTVRAESETLTGTGQWVELNVSFEVEVDTEQWAPAVVVSGGSSSKARFWRLRLESDAGDGANSAAQAAALSATLAAASAEGADLSASAAQIDRLEAETARTGSELARDAAVVAKESAENASASALDSLVLSSRVVGQGVGILVDQFLGTDSGWVTWTAAPSYAANTRFPIGREATWNLTANSSAGIRLDSNNAAWSGAKNASAYYVEFDFILNSGSATGMGIVLDWINTSGTVFSSQKPVAQLVSQPIVVGQVMTARGVFTKPTNFSGTFSRHDLFIKANFVGFNGTQAAKNVTIHRVFARTGTAEEVGDGVVQATVEARHYTIAQTDNAISSSATTLQSSINAKGKVIYSSSNPATADRLTQNLWIDTTGGLNIPKRWNGSAWVEVSDKTPENNAVSTVNANLTNNYYTKTATDSAIAASSLNLQSSIDNKGKVIYSSTTPVTGDSLTQNLWIDTTGNLNVPKRWNGSSWVAVSDKTPENNAVSTVNATLTNNYYTAVQTDSAISTASLGLQSSIDTKGKVIYSSSEPVTGDRLVQNLWIDTTGGLNIPKRWNGTSWVATSDKTPENNAVSTINATLTNDYYTRTTVDGAIAGSESTLRSEYRNAVPTVPSNFLNGLVHWTTSLTAGSPENTTSTTNLVHITDDAVFGNCGERTFTASAQGLATRGVVPGRDKVYRITCRFKVTSITGATSMQLGFGVVRMNGAFGNLGSGLLPDTNVSYNASTTVVHTLTHTVSATAGPGITSVLSSITDAEFLRFYLRTATGGTAVVRVAEFKVEEISAVSSLNATVTTQGTAITSLQNGASAGYLIRAQAGNAVSLLDLVAADGVGGPVSVAKISADNILLDGTVSTSKLIIGNTSNSYLDYDCEDAGFYTSTTGHAITFVNTTDSNLGRRFIQLETTPAQSIVQSSWFPIENLAHFRVSGAIWASSATPGVTLEIELGSISGTTVTPTRRVVVATRNATSILRSNIDIETTASEKRARFIATKASNANTASLGVGGFRVMRRDTGELLVNGSITSEQINTTSMSVAGLSVFGGNLQSTNFVTGSNGSGWRIQNSGAAEFGTLALRENSISNVYFTTNNTITDVASSNSDFVDLISLTVPAGTTVRSITAHALINQYDGSFVQSAQYAKFDYQLTKNGSLIGGVANAGVAGNTTPSLLLNAQEMDFVQSTYVLRAKYTSGSSAFIRFLQKTIYITEFKR